MKPYHLKRGLCLAKQRKERILRNIAAVWSKTPKSTYTFEPLPFKIDEEKVAKKNYTVSNIYENWLNPTMIRLSNCYKHQQKGNIHNKLKAI